jgi:DNA-directed RNA polymerase specialized sigma24 family protein
MTCSMPAAYSIFRKICREVPEKRYESRRNIADQAPDPERRVAKAQIILLLRMELHGLSPKMQEVVTSYYGHDHSLQEVADALGIRSQQ